MVYNWQQKGWPHFSYQLIDIEDDLYAFAEKAGRIRGMVQTLPKDAQMETIIDVLVSEAIKTSEIEGEYLNRKDVRSSLKNNLGLNSKLEPVNDARVGGVAELMLQVRKTYKDPLTRETLIHWQNTLLRGRKDIQTGSWRTHEDPMQIISGALGKQKVHFEAPPSDMVPEEMKRFIEWFNATAPQHGNDVKQGPIRSAIAHIYFESIHPFEDGNGRIGRAISEKALSQSVGQPMLISLSRAIDENKKGYYEALHKASLSNELTHWIRYFVKIILKAQGQTEKQIEFTLKKARLFDRYRDLLNDRQFIIIKRMLEEGPQGFEGGMNARKYVSLTKTSKATATRDMQDLLEKGIFQLKSDAGGRSTAYELKL